MTKLSFAKVDGAGSSAPVTSPEVVDENASPKNLPATTTPPAGRSLAFYTGADDDEAPEDTAGRVRRPYINLVQPTSKDIKNVAPEGNFVLAKTVKIPPGTRIVVIGFGRTFYREKVKWGTEGRTVFSLEDVVAAGGTDKWNQSKENEKSDSRKPWFAPCITALLLIEKPAEADEAFFPHVIGDKAYAAALFEAKSTAYDSFYIDLNSKRKTTNLFKAGWASRFIALKSQKGKGEDASFKPVPEVLEAAPPEFLELAKKIASE